MPLMNSREIFKNAYEGKYAIGAFNVNNMEIIKNIKKTKKNKNKKGFKR